MSILLAPVGLLYGQQPRGDIGVQLAHRLAISTLSVSARKLPGLRFDAEKSPHSPKFYWFEITAHTPEDVSPLLGYYAVNRKTGDVWDAVACTRLTSRFVHDTQMRIRRADGGTAFSIAAKVAPCEP